MTISLVAAPDGLSGTIQIGGVDKVTITSAGNLTTTGKVIQAAQSMVRLNGTNGYGSTNTKISRYLTTVVNQGTDITYADSATLGASFTINTSGVYSVCVNGGFSSATYTGLSLNTTQPTTNIGALTNAAEGLGMGFCNNSGSASWVGYLAAGSVVRPHNEGVGQVGNAVNHQFTINRVA